MRLSKLRSKFYKHIHPSVRLPLLRGQKNRRRIVKRSALQLIRRKYTYLDVKPRIPPLHCPRCGLATRFISTIRNHDCTIRNIFHWRGTGAGACAELNTLGDDEIDEDLLAMGGRNRMRDGMGILERFARPQNVTMYDIDYNEPNKSTVRLPPTTGRSVPTLSELVLRMLVPPRSYQSSIPSQYIFEKKNIKIVAKRKIGKGRRDGHFCPPCGNLFASFDDYDVHLESSINENGEETNACRITPPNPIPVLLNDRTAPAEHDFSSRRLKRPIDEGVIDCCTACGMDGFETKIHLHTHIFECAKKIEYTRIAEAIHKRRHLLNKI